MPSTSEQPAAPRTQRLPLLEQVVDGGYCVGCGACCAVAGSPLEMGLDDIGRLQPLYRSHDSGSGASNDALAAVCPFSDESEDEDTIADRLYETPTGRHPMIGHHLATFAGYANDPPFRDRGSSGGLLNWACAELLKQGVADRVVHVRPRQPDDADPRMFEYCVSDSVDALVQRSKSRYYPIELSGVMQRVRDEPARYVFVGLPCFVKAARLLMRQDPVLADRIKVCLAMVCGHLKTTRFASFLSWQAGVEPSELEAIDFRLKLPPRPASDYGVQATARPANGEQRVAEFPVYEMYGTDWGLGFFKYEACDFCDDVLGETADASFGDAWLPEYYRDPAGTNVLVVRSALLRDLFDKAADEGRVHLESLSADRVAASQAGGLRHRRVGLSYRLHRRDRQGRWRPRKRVAASSLWRRPIYRRVIAQREQLAAESHGAFEAALRSGRFETFRERMDPLVRQYQRTSRVRGAWVRRRLGKVKRLALGLIHRG